jgi:hypothetical protein
MNAIWTYWLLLTGSNTSISSKRFIAIVCLFLLIAVVIVNLSGVVVADVIYYTLAGLITGNSALTLVPQKPEVPVATPTPVAPLPTAQSPIGFEYNQNAG